VWATKHICIEKMMLSTCKKVDGENLHMEEFINLQGTKYWEGHCKDNIKKTSNPQQCASCG
jgi:hypothetical protein